VRASAPQRLRLPWRRWGSRRLVAGSWGAEVTREWPIDPSPAAFYNFVLWCFLDFYDVFPRRCASGNLLTLATEKKGTLVFCGFARWFTSKTGTGIQPIQNMEKLRCSPRTWKQHIACSKLGLTNENGDRKQPNMRNDYAWMIFHISFQV
jgi:hypothetical protein